MKRASISKRTRFEVFKRDGFICQYCGSKPPQTILHLDHIIPVSKGGGNELINYITSCVDCNLGKSDKLLSDKIAPVQIVKDAEQERLLQLQELNKWLKSKRKMQDQWFRDVSDFWLELEGEDPKQFIISGNRADSVRVFLSKMPCEEIIDALRIASCRKGVHSYGFFKFFYGVCWRKIKGD